MKRFFLLLFFNCAFFIVHCTFSQNPLVKMWDRRFGGTNQEIIFSLKQTTDEGYILGGHSYSGISGDKTQGTWGQCDFWIIKMDSISNKQWDKDFGTLDYEDFKWLQQTTDGGYILGGYTPSGISGDKTQLTQGFRDYWIVKTDSIGNKQWDKDFGGTYEDHFYSLLQTFDKGFILGGMSASGIGGDKTQPTRGGADYWMVKIDSLGNKQWDKDFGGTDYDGLSSISQTKDGGYIIGGSSVSGVGGDKTELNWDTITPYTRDYWIVKTDFLGNIQWDKDFGGTNEDWLYSIQQTTDGGYILGGYSNSGMSGDKSKGTWGGTDYWIIKIDSMGNKQWDRDLGGTDNEEFGTVSQTSDGGYLISGDSYSPISGNKTESNLGIEQTWAVKTDSLGNILWDKTIFTPGHDESGLAIQTSDGCYAIANSTDGGIGGYKTEIGWGNRDYWIVKLCETLQAGFTSPSFLCPGTCLNFINLSLQATSYQWSFPGATPPTSTDVNPQNICYPNPGSYDVQLFATNANGSDTLTLSNYITVYPTPPPQAITQSGDTLFAIAGGATYQWYFNGNIISAATDYFYVAAASGDYNVVATDASGCEVEAAVFNIIASAQFEVSGLRFEVYPNPVIDKCTIHNAQFTMGTAIEISIYNMLGEMVLDFPASSIHHPTSIDVSQLPPSLYYLEINSDEKLFRTKFVKQ